MLVSVSLGGLPDLNGPNEDMIYFLPYYLSSLQKRFHVPQKLGQPSASVEDWVHVRTCCGGLRCTATSVSCGQEGVTDCCELPVCGFFRFCCVDWCKMPGSEVSCYPCSSVSSW
jgi:hypothetical protein